MSLQVDGDHVAGGVQQLQFAFADEIRRGNVAVDRIPVHLADDDFFMGGRHVSRQCSVVGRQRAD